MNKKSTLNFKEISVTFSHFVWRYNTQYNDTQPNNTRHVYIQHNDNITCILGHSTTSISLRGVCPLSSKPLMVMTLSTMTLSLMAPT
jgi:hypothetical protein